MGEIKTQPINKMGKWHLGGLFLMTLCLIYGQAQAFTLVVKDNATGVNLTTGYRWLLEEDNTLQAEPGNTNGVHVRDNSISLNIHIVMPRSSPRDMPTARLPR